MKKILIRLDADAKTGLGHLYRSLAIAGELKKNGFRPIFLSGLNSRAEQEISQNGFDFLVFNPIMNEEDNIRFAAKKANAELIFIDKLYPYSAVFVQELKIRYKTVLFHNDCEGSLHADAFILPAAHSPEEMIAKYRNRASGQFFYGADYVVLSEQARQMAETAKVTKKYPNKICISTGGSDPEGIMIGILKALSQKRFQNFTIKALPGSNFMHEKALNRLIPELPPEIEISRFNMKDFTDTQCAFTTFGVLSYELIHAGIPLLSTAHALPNATGSKNMEQRCKCLKDLGMFKNLTTGVILKEFDAFIRDRELQEFLKKNAEQLIDGKGAQRTAQIQASLLSGNLYKI